MTDYKYTMRFTAQKLAQLIEVAFTAIGEPRTVDEIGASGNRGMSFTFNGTDITPAQRQAALDALPPFVKEIYIFSRTVIDEE